MRKRGFTLVELLVVITVMGIIFIFIYHQYLYQQNALRSQQQTSEMNIKARRASEYIANELRQLGLSQAPLEGLDQFGIVAGALNSISYTRDDSTEGIIDYPADTHSIAQRGDTLFIDGDRALNFLETLEFAYIDVNGDTVDPVNDTIREVDWFGGWVMQDPEPGNEGNSPGNYPINRINYVLKFVYPDSEDTVTYREAVQIRNLRGPTAK